MNRNTGAGGTVRDGGPSLPVACMSIDGSLQIQTDTGVDLGVQDREVNWVTNEDNDIVAFVLNGDLWSYNQNTGMTVRVLSFRQRALSAAGAGGDASEGSETENAVVAASQGRIVYETGSGQAAGRTGRKKDAPDLDDRSELTPDDIRIERVSEEGNIIFIVYGYMASGSHEGNMGVYVCTYKASSNTVQEKIFIPMDQGFENLSANVSRLSYGLVKSGDAVTDRSGNIVCGVYRLCIQGMDGALREDYVKDGIYITQTEQEGNGLKLTLATKQGGESGGGQGLGRCAERGAAVCVGARRLAGELHDRCRDTSCGSDGCVS